MIQQIFDALPDWAKSKIVIRITYTLASLAAAHAMTFLSMPAVQHVLVKVFVNPQLQPGAEEFLKTSIIALMMAAGEVLINNIHDNHVLPAIQGGKS